jgi:Mrp family chromosome partitioning ATPase
MMARDHEARVLRLPPVAQPAGAAVGPDCAADRQRAADRRVKPAFAESFRLLAGTLRQLAEAQPLQTVLVMGAYAGDGRTLTVANLGRALAEAGERVLLVEADQRRPALRRHFVTARAEAPEAGADRSPIVIMPTSVPNLDLVTCAATPKGEGDPAALERALAALRPQCDYIVVDSPPCLRYADAFLYAPLVDGVLYVVRRRGQDVAAQRDAQARLARLGARVLGVVFNER